MKTELSDAELLLMREVWNNPGIIRKDLAEQMFRTEKWVASTSYTLITRCEKKGAITRDRQTDGCFPVYGRESVQKEKLTKFANMLFGGSCFELLSTFVKQQDLSAEDIKRLKELVANLDESEK